MLSRTSLLCLSAFAVAAAACGGDGSGERSVSPAGDGAAAVIVADMRFEPETVEIEAGETVTWSFEDRMPHDVAFDGGPASPKLRTGEWQRTFHHPGSYGYVCTLHPIMKGTVSVG